MTPEETTVLVQSVVAEAQRLGLTWTMRAATVTTTAPTTGIYDGDETPIPLIDTVGVLYGDRVWVIGIPQGGNYILGPASPRGGLKARVDDTNSSAAVGAEAVVLTLPTMLWRPGSAYKARFRGGTLSSGANSFIYRIRQTSIVGTILHVTQDLGNTTGRTMFDEMYIVRTGSELTDNLVLTLAAGAGTVQMLGNAAFVRYFEVEEMRDGAASYPNAVAIV